MNLTKKLFSYIVAIAMIFTLTAFAGGAVNAANAKTYALTLQNNGKTTHTFEVYQIFTGDLSEGILSNVQWGNGVSEEGKTTLGDAAKKAEDLAKSDNDSLPVKTFAEDLQKYLQNSTEKEVAANQTASIEGLAAGYYLVKDKASSQNQTNGAYTSYILKVVKDITATTKLDVPTVEKKVQDTNDSTGKTSGWQDSADYDIGDEIPYQITGSMPANIGDYKSYKYVFTDTMGKGLSFKTGSAKIMIGTTEVTGKFTENVTTNDDGSTVTWTCDDLKTAGVELTSVTKVVVTYKATLNKKAVTGSAGNPNTVNLTYSNNPNKGGEGETGKTPDDKNIVFTYKAVVNKVDQDKKSLAGAGFTLQKKVNGAYTDVKSFTAGEATTFTFTGLDDGEYKLIESTTPAGYNTITPIEFTISATHDEESADPKLTELTVSKVSGEATFTADKDAGSLTTDVVNKKGSTLPETGGMGTTLLYVAGGILVACAAAYVVLNKKRA
ncbi:fimbrial protein [Intestinibaculum porci]|uniref:Fimbrial protein n=1 Tax=Intestinibaculum porci TaxID=2487118 RepID=A0A3G9J2Z4_9FIRM|nr:isopeptide-forming domain-containing fimbrial protein [Intestinibaculum porci]BBH25530.1 fimbrial protein [Intestinibaculum porci]